MKKLVLFSLLAFVLTGCATVGRPINQVAVSKIEKGITTREEVISLMGSPEEIMKDTEGNITMKYIYGRATAKPQTFIPIIGGLIGGYDMQKQEVMITIDSDGKVKDVFSTVGATESNMNLSSSSKAKTEEVEKDKRPK